MALMLRRSSIRVDKKEGYAINIGRVVSKPLNLSERLGRINSQPCMYLEPLRATA